MQRRRKATFCQYGSAPVKLFFRTSGANPPPPFGHGAHRHCFCNRNCRLTRIADFVAVAQLARHHRGLGALRDRSILEISVTPARATRDCRIRRRVSDADNFVPVVRLRIRPNRPFPPPCKSPRSSRQLSCRDNQTIVRQSPRGGSPRAQVSYLASAEETGALCAAEPEAPFSDSARWDTLL
jgi:hypothetical protein